MNEILFSISLLILKMQLLNYKVCIFARASLCNVSHHKHMFLDWAWGSIWRIIRVELG